MGNQNVAASLRAKEAAYGAEVGSLLDQLIGAVASFKGRKPSVDAAELRRLRDEEKLGPAAIARRLGIGRATVYRVLGTSAPT